VEKVEERQATSKSQVVKWLKELRDAIPKSSDVLSAHGLEIWASRLCRIPGDVLAAAALILIERMTFFPSLAEILDVCRELMHEGDVPMAGEAYEQVTTAMVRVGYYQPCPTFSHPAIGDAVRAIGGWRYLCSSENVVSDRARFFEVYERFRQRAQREESMPDLAKQIAAKYSERQISAGAPAVAASPKKANGARVIPIRSVLPRLEELVPSMPAVSTGIVGDAMTDEEWEERKRLMKASLDDGRLASRKEVISPNAGGQSA
jgi:hypothetical protein